MIKHLTFLFLIPLFVSFPNIVQKLLVKEVTKIILYLKYSEKEEKQVFDFFKLFDASLSRLRFSNYFYDIIKGRSIYIYRARDDFLAKFYVDYLLLKKTLKFSIAELENKLIETQRSLRAYMIPKGLLELRFQGQFYFV